MEVSLYSEPPSLHTQPPGQTPTPTWTNDLGLGMFWGSIIYNTLSGMHLVITSSSQGSKSGTVELGKFSNQNSLTLDEVSKITLNQLHEFSPTDVSDSLVSNHAI